MRLLITGATGFIGSALCAALLQRGHALTMLTRGSPHDANTGTKRWLQWTPGALRGWESVLEDVDGVINLAGEPIAERRWTEAQKRRIEKSRMDATRSLVQACAKAKQKPHFLINASAVGYYGARGDETLTEASAPGKDFLSMLCRDWEEEAKKAEELGMRVVCLRTGIVLASGGGALAKMALPFKFFLGGSLGSGQQRMSWIHREDHVGLIMHLIDHTDIHGAVNATAPNPARNKEFCKTLGKVMGRPCWASVPGFALKTIAGDMAEMLLTGQRVLPVVAEKSGYRFRYSNLHGALEACMPL